MPKSPFLQIPESIWILSNDLTFAIVDQYPVSHGHSLVITKRLVETWFEATQDEVESLRNVVVNLWMRLPPYHVPVKSSLKDPRYWKLVFNSNWPLCRPLRADYVVEFDQLLKGLTLENSADHKTTQMRLTLTVQSTTVLLSSNARKVTRSTVGLCRAQTVHQKNGSPLKKHTNVLIQSHAVVDGGLFTGRDLLAVRMRE